MTSKKIKEKVRRLRKEIRHHNYLYHVKNQPEISDGKYDKLLKELQGLEDKYPELKTPDSPTARVGTAPQKEFKKIKHIKKMFSLQGVQKDKEVEDFDRRCKEKLNLDELAYMCEPKLDGLSVELRYEKGRFIQGATRGNGVEGENITENLKTIRSIPLRLQKKDIDHLVVRAEVIMYIKDFQELNKRYTQQGKQAFANPRNAAAGSVRQLDSGITAERKLETFIYEIMALSDKKITTQKEALEFLGECGFKINPETRYCKDIKEAVKYHRDIEKKRDELDYEIDGVVIKVNNLDYYERLGTRATNPRWALAFKFEPRKEITTVEDIVVQVGRTGILTPVALLKPVEVGGVTVSRATLHNMDEIRRKDVKIKDKVRVQRAGDVIPQVVGVNKRARTGKEKTFNMPRKCPSCGSTVMHEEVYYLCAGGLSCPAQMKESIEHFASKEAMDIEFLSDKTIELFYEKGLIKSVSDIYKLKKEDIAKLPGWKEKSTQNLINAIKKSKDTTFSRFIYALGIRHVGRHLADVLAENFKDINGLKKAKRENLEQISEVGPKVAESIYKFFHNRKNLDIIEELTKSGIKIKRQIAVGKLKGLTFLFTGSLDSYSRSEAKKLVESEGADVASGVSDRVDYLVIGENPGSKLNQAKKKGIKVINEKEFKKLLAR